MELFTNITDFGAFVDIGVHQDGLVHMSQMANRYIKHPSEVRENCQQKSNSKKSFLVDYSAQTYCFDNEVGIINLVK